MEKKILVEIKNSACVEVAGKRVIGKQLFPEKEAQRLVDLGVAVLIPEAAPAAENNSSVNSSQLKSEIPDMTWKKEELIYLLKTNNIEYADSDTKEILINKFNTCKADQAGAHRV
jgi:hypothetical protein